MDRFGTVRMIIDAGTVIQGKLSLDAHARIEGRLNGEVFSSKALIIGGGGRVEARIEAAEVVILGEFSGSISAAERVEILRGGRVNAEISAPRLLLEEGARFEGRLRIGASSRDALSPRRAKAPPSGDAELKS